YVYAVLCLCLFDLLLLRSLFLISLPPPSSTLFPYTTLFRSHDMALIRHGRDADGFEARTHLLDIGAMPETLHLAHLEVERLRHRDRKSTRLNSSHVKISYAVFCLKKKRNKEK